MQLDYYNFMFDVQSVDSLEGKNQQANYETFFDFSLVFPALHLGSEIIAAYDMMLRIVREYMDSANYFTIELKHKFSEYDVQSKAAESVRGKADWKQFFSETYAESA